MVSIVTSAAPGRARPTLTYEGRGCFGFALSSPPCAPLERAAVSASSGCSDERFNTPSEIREAGETARTLHHCLQTLTSHDPAFLPPSSFGKRVKWVKQQNPQKAGQDCFPTLKLSARPGPIHRRCLAAAMYAHYEHVLAARYGQLTLCGRFRFFRGPESVPPVAKSRRNSVECHPE